MRVAGSEEFFDPVIFEPLSVCFMAFDLAVPGASADVVGLWPIELIIPVLWQSLPVRVYMTDGVTYELLPPGSAEFPWPVNGDPPFVTLTVYGNVKSVPRAVVMTDSSIISLVPFLARELLPASPLGEVPWMDGFCVPSASSCSSAPPGLESARQSPVAGAHEPDVEAIVKRTLDPELLVPGHEAVALVHPPPVGGDWGYVLRQAADDGCVLCMKRIVAVLGPKLLCRRCRFSGRNAIEVARDACARDPGRVGDYDAVILYIRKMTDGITDE